MSYVDIKDELISLVSQPTWVAPDGKVIALRGPWGCGKTYLWEKELKPELKTNNVKSIYASAFGLRSLDSLEYVLHRACLYERMNDGSEKRAALFGNSVSNIFEWVADKLKIEDGAENLRRAKDIFKLATEAMARESLRGKLIVLDDLERKHDEFEILDLLGWIDKRVRNDNNRFLLIFNEDKLNEVDQDRWDEFYEKVVTHKLTMQIQVIDAVEVSGITADSKRRLGPYIEQLGVNNIRVIQRIANHYNELLNRLGVNNVTENGREYLAHAMVLIAAIHYNADSLLPSGLPNFAFLNKYPYGTAAKKWNAEQRALVEPKDQNNEDQQHEAWEKLLAGYAWRQTTDIDNLLMEYLETGRVKQDEFSKIFHEIQYHLNKEALERNAYRILDNLIWETQSTRAKHLEEFEQKIGRQVGLLPLNLVVYCVDLLGAIDEIPKSEQIQREWATCLKARTDMHKKVLVREDDLSKLPPILLAAVREHQSIRDSLTLVDALIHMEDKSGWGTEHEQTVGAATQQDYVNMLKTLSGDNLQKVFIFHNRWLGDNSSDRTAIQHGVKMFCGALTIILRDEPESRIADTIRICKVRFPKFFDSRYATNQP